MAALSETRVRAAKPAEKPYKIFDKQGLFLLVAPSGGRLWRFRYRFGSAEKLLSLDSYPDVPLRSVREKRDEARRLLADRRHSENHASIRDPPKISELMRAIHGNNGEPTTRAALKLAALAFVRPGELRMKMGEPHVVPLCTQALTVLREIQGRTGGGRFVFPSLLTRDRAMSENMMNTALCRLGYSNEEMTGHGFRSRASTCLPE